MMKKKIIKLFAILAAVFLGSLEVGWRFFNRAALEIKEDTVIDLVITPKDGTPIKTNIKVTKEDLELLETLKNMKN